MKSGDVTPWRTSVSGYVESGEIFKRITTHCGTQALNLNLRPQQSSILQLSLTDHNWQEKTKNKKQKQAKNTTTTTSTTTKTQKSGFLSCPCHKIYREEVVGHLLPIFLKTKQNKRKISKTNKRNNNNKTKQKKTKQ